MPTLKVKAPEALQPYLFHGLDLQWSEGDKDATGDCPWCGREGKFSVNTDTGIWRCFVCGEGNSKGGGNIHVFLRHLWELSDKATTDYSELAKSRRLLYEDTLMHWGVAKSIITGEWLVPGYNVDGKLMQLYRYSNGKLLATKGMDHQLFLPDAYDFASAEVVYICEGPWDAMALWEVLSHCKQGDSGLVPTASVDNSLLENVVVLAVPGCQVFFEKWAKLLSGKIVNLMYDNDHPTIHPTTGKTLQPAGYSGMIRAAKLLAACKQPPSTLNWLQWWDGDEVYNHTLPAGYDVRDSIANLGGTPVRPLGQRIAALEGLLGRVSPIPSERLGGAARGLNGAATGKASPTELGCLLCTDYTTLIRGWRKALRWTDGLDHALAVMLASVASTKSLGDQLWVKVIGPAACGKSTLCEALSVNKEYVFAKSTVRGFHSGYRTDDGGGATEDNSLIVQINGKTLITKDGDTLLQSPNLPQILSEARDLYDSTSRSHYRNKMGKDYEGIRMTWILCGTSSLRAIDSSELGERFLDCVIMEGIDDELEDEILWRVVNRADRNVSIESDGEAVTRYEPELAEVMQLTGGYVSWLRKNAADVMSTIQTPDWAKRLCARLGKFTAFMRARPSIRQEETAEREFATRLASQLMRLSKCMALVLNRDTVDVEVMKRTRRVALDTSRGQTLAIIAHLATVESGMESYTVATYLARDEQKLKSMLRFLKHIGAIEAYIPVSPKGVKGRMRWRLTRKMARLYQEVVATEVEDHAQE